MKRVMLVIVYMYASIHMVNTGVHRVNAGVHRVYTG